MKLMIEIAVCILSTSVTGTILFGIWYFIGKTLERAGFINLMYELLKAVLLFWLLPISYLVLVFYNYERWGGFLFRFTPILGIASVIVDCVWLIFVLFGLFMYIRKSVGMKNKYKNSVVVGEEVYELFLSVCKDFGIKDGKLDLVYDTDAISPYLAGLFKCYISFPPKEYTDEQLKIIFAHEIVHYKQKNYLMRHFTEIAGILHFCNPLFVLFREKVHAWGEYACDFEVISKIDNPKRYLEVIYYLYVDNTSKNELESFLFDSKNELEKRFELIKRRYKVKKSRLFATMVVFAMFTLSTMSVKAATETAGEQYYNYYFTTSEDVGELNEIEGVEYTAKGFDRGVFVKKERFHAINPLDLISFNWTIKKDRAQSSYDFKVNAGQSVYVSATTSPSTAQFRMGIVEPTGTLRYVVGTGGSYHSFSISSTGKYAVYVQNMSTGEIRVGGFYNVE